jgi:hypothetical protein
MVGRNPLPVVLFDHLCGFSILKTTTMPARMLAGTHKLTWQRQPVHQVGIAVISGGKNRAGSTDSAAKHQPLASRPDQLRRWKRHSKTLNVPAQQPHTTCNAAMMATVGSR